MYNTFFRIFKNKKMAKVLSNICHTILLWYYMVARLFLKKKSDLTSDDANKIMQKCSKKPNMEADCINKKLNKDLSIIVPAYNAEKTIRECIDSVIKQVTDIEYELIIINDGSKDKTGQLVLEYSDEIEDFQGQETEELMKAPEDILCFWIQMICLLMAVLTR